MSLSELRAMHRVSQDTVQLIIKAAQHVALIYSFVDGQVAVVLILRRWIQTAQLYKQTTKLEHNGVQLVHDIFIVLIVQKLII